MKANELMIGDWVLINGTPRKIQAVDGVDDEIMADDEIYTLAKDRYHSEDRVEGVPITPEILEKNFQEFLPGINLMYQLKGPYCAMNEDGQWVFGLVSVNGEKRYPLVKIKFVHQLQNALRLCGIEHEITI